MPLPTRTDESSALLLDSLVVRGGKFEKSSILAGIESCYLKHGVYGFSVMATRAGDITELYATSVPLRNYKEYRASTFSMVSGEGFTLLPSFKAPHYTLDIGGPMDDRIWESLMGVFSEPLLAPEWEAL